MWNMWKYEELQSHIYECDKIWEMRKLDKVKEPKYEMIENGNINEQLMIVKIFRENFKILEKQRMVKNSWHQEMDSQEGPGDRLTILSAVLYLIILSGNILIDWLIDWQPTPSDRHLKSHILIRKGIFAFEKGHA